MLQKNTSFQYSAKLLILSALFLVIPMLAQALGIGNARVLSRLGEPLNVELELLVNNPRELQSVFVNLANAQEFEQAGIERPGYLSTARFKIENQSGKPIVRLTTLETVKDPVVTLLLELSGSENRILKEYTVLLDPPELTKKSAQLSPVAKSSPITLGEAASTFDAFQEKMPTAPLNQVNQKEQNLALQTRLNKIETQLTTISDQKQTLQDAKTLLQEENNQLHDLVQLKQKEIDTLRIQASTIEAPQATAKHSVLDNNKMMLDSSEEASSAPYSLFLSPWFLLGMLLTVTLGAGIAFKKNLQRKFLLGKNLDGADSESGEEIIDEELFQNETPKGNQHSFNEVISLLQTQNTDQAKFKNTSGAFIKPPEQKKTIEMQPNLEDVDVYITFGKFKLAEQAILSILKQQPQNAQARLKFVDFLLSQNKPEEAQAQFKLLPEDFAKNFPDQYQNYHQRFNEFKAAVLQEKNQQDTEVTHLDISEIYNTELEPSPELISAFGEKTKPETESISSSNSPELPSDPTVFQTKLEFAKVYIEMQDKESARDLLNEVIQFGPDSFKKEAQELMSKLI